MYYSYVGGKMIKENWEEVKTAIKEEYGLTDIAYKTWIEPLSVYSEDNKEVKILIPSDKGHALSYITTRFTSYFQVMISEMFDDTYEITFILEKDINQNGAAHNQIQQSPAPTTIHNPNCNLNPKYVFSSFVVGNNNSFAHSASLAVAESPGEVYNPLYIYGGAGLGKTHLMYAIGNYILENNPNMNVLYVTSEQFTNEVIESIRSGNSASMTRLRDKYRTVDVLLFDDVQFIFGKDRSQEEFFHTFNAIKSAGKAIIMSSDRPLNDLDNLDERVISRFKQGLTAVIQPPDYETRVAILEKKAEYANKKINNDVIEFIANNIKSNIRELEGALEQVIAYSKFNKMDITIDTAEQALKDIINPNREKRLTPQFIIGVIAQHYGVSTEDICSKKRNADLVTPRHIAMYLIREMTDTSLVNIGKILGGKDHSSVMHGYEKIKSIIQDDSNNSENIKTVNNINIIKKKLIPS